MKNTEQQPMATRSECRSASRQWLTFRVSQEEKKHIEEQASFVSLSLSEYMRRRMFGGRPVIARPTGGRTDEALLRELRRVGGLLKHNFEVVRQADGDGTHLREMNDAFRQLVACISRVNKAHSTLT